jgi:uncharacterized protein with PhoU and TrkA domain
MKKNQKVEDLFLQMKDTSELMVDLAYSALLFNDKKIAEEVYHLEDTIDDLYRRIQRFAVKKTSKKNPDMALALIRLADSIESIGDSAREIADVVLRDIEPHPVVKMSIRESDAVITRVNVLPKSILVNKSLGKLRLASETGMWLIAIRRGRKWIFGPDENTKIKNGDILIARGPEAGEKVLIKAAKGKLRKL